jgi:uncharacterized membrane protein required for colicin V production
MKVDLLILWTKLGWVDIVFVVVFTASVFLGLKKGLGVMGRRALALTLAQVISFEYYQVFAHFVNVRASFFPLIILEVIFFVILVIVAYLLVNFLGFIISLIANIKFKDPASHIGGALFGGVGSILMLGIVTSFLLFFPIPQILESFESKSLSGPYLRQVTPKIHQWFSHLIPASWRAQS